MQEISGEQAVLTVLDIVKGYWLSRTVWVAAELGIADQLANGGKSESDLAAALHVPAGTLRRVMRALISEGFFAEVKGQYVNSAKSEGLRSDVPGSIRAVARAELGQEHYGAWEELLHCVKTGQNGMKKHFNQDVWDYYPSHPEHGSVFNESMTNITAGVEQAVLEAYEFDPFKHIVDIGGGHGRLLSKVLGKNYKANGTLFDLPSVISAANELDAHAERTKKVPGDFFKRVPTGGDLYMLKFIIHDWADEESKIILSNVRGAMAADGKVILVEIVLPDTHEPAFGKFMDLNMLVMTGGRERTHSEYERLLGSAGLKVSRIVPTRSIFSIVEAVAG